MVEKNSFINQPEPLPTHPKFVIRRYVVLMNEWSAADPNSQERERVQEEAQTLFKEMRAAKDPDRALGLTRELFENQCFLGSFALAVNYVNKNVLTLNEVATTLGGIQSIVPKDIGQEMNAELLQLQCFPQTQSEFTKRRITQELHRLGITAHKQLPPCS